MKDVVIFRELPATFPERDKYRKPSILGTIIVHTVIVVLLVLIPLVAHQTITDTELLITLVSPLPPPPGPPPPPPQAVSAAPPKVEPRIQPLEPQSLVMPTEIPKEISRIIDEPAAPAGVAGGVPGGVPGGVVSGILGQILSSSKPLTPPPPPAPPPPPPTVAPAAPIRVGGVVREPRIVKLVPPVYPVLAAKARVAGMVVLEAVVTAEGDVDEIRVVSGHPLLVEAAIECVKQWKYEPTLLNGVPVAVILTAKVSFNYRPIS